ncbi:MAG: tetratricopeptide repeat protein, partial [Alphaproteobacteria bacterium]|nr:tetratricopeptide repeat protein [Alphaproteobacteria bacterium]
MNDDFQTLLQSAQRQLNEGAAEAAETARQLAERFPQAPETWLVLGVLARREGRLSEAERGFQKLADLAPGHPEPWRQIGLTRQAALDREGAERAFRQALAASPSDPGLLCHLGQVLRETGRLSEAEDCYRQAEIPPGWMGLAECLIERGRPDLIAEPCERALAAEPTSAQAALRLAQIRLMAGRFAEAEAIAAT